MPKKANIIGQIRPLSLQEKADIAASLVNEDVKDKGRVPALISVGEHYFSGMSWMLVPQIVPNQKPNMINPRVIERPA